MNQRNSIEYSINFSEIWKNDIILEFINIVSYLIEGEINYIIYILLFKDN